MLFTVWGEPAFAIVLLRALSHQAISNMHDDCAVPLVHSHLVIAIAKAKSKLKMMFAFSKCECCIGFPKNLFVCRHFAFTVAMVVSV